MNVPSSFLAFPRCPLSLTSGVGQNMSDTSLAGMSDDQLAKEMVTFKDVAHHFAPLKAEYDRRQLAKTVTHLLEVAHVLVQETVKLSVLTRALKWLYLYPRGDCGDTDIHHAT